LVDDLEFNADSKNIILQTNGDSGDALGRTGNVFQYIGMTRDDRTESNFEYNKERFHTALHALEDPFNPGDYVRYSLPPYNDPRDMSRDNKTQAVMAMGSMGMTRLVVQAFLADLKRFLRTPNGDIVGPIDLALYYRSLWASLYSHHYLGVGHWIKVNWPKPLMLVPYPLLMLMELYQILSILVICLVKGRQPGSVRVWLADKLGLYFLVQDYPKSVNPTNPNSWSLHGKYNVGDDVITRRFLSMSKRFLPTPTMWVARKIYSYLRPAYENVPYLGFDPATNTTYKIRECEATAAQYPDDVYYMPSSFANPVNELYRKMNREDFSKSLLK
jgi:hypothetical protein